MGLGLTLDMLMAPYRLTFSYEINVRTDIPNYYLLTNLSLCTGVFPYLT